MSKLAIVGSGEYLEPMVPVDQELVALTGSTPTVACLPTAAGREGDAKIDEWMRRGVEHFQALGCDAHGVRVWDRSTADSPDCSERIAAADIVYLSGGRPSYLRTTLDGTRSWAAIEHVLSRDGLLIGCSAGAMVQGERFAGGFRRRSGFALWPGIHIVPHFDEIPSAVVAAMRLLVGRRLTVVGVDGNTALVSVDGTYRVIGGEVTIWSSDGRSSHAAGPLPAGLLPG